MNKKEIYMYTSKVALFALIWILNNFKQRTKIYMEYMDFEK